jgi:DNA-binding IclR family transcriptional regulator
MTLRTFSVAAPVVSSDGVVAAIGLVTTTARRDLQRLAPAVQVAAAGIGRRLGSAHP